MPSAHNPRLKMAVVALKEFALFELLLEREPLLSASNDELHRLAPFELVERGPELLQG